MVLKNEKYFVPVNLLVYFRRFLSDTLIRSGNSCGGI